MPLRKSPRTALAAATLATLAVGAAVPVGASAALSSSLNLSCTAPALSKPLAKWGDTSDYWLATGGDFESSLAGWSVKNAAIASGNETLGVIAGTKSLKLGVGIGSAEATTPEFCVDPLHPKFRFVVKTNSTVAALNTYINFKTPLGVTLTVPAKLNSVGSGNWTLSQSQPLSTAIPDVFLGTGTTASITFKSVTSTPGAAVSVDNLLIDPYRRG
ncbi:MAG: hypothetical protein J7513_18435 [Solirubrobacteraceae bacterium]|nr:hypothetical protein [Solirubrobacteraceae bacterium]